MGPYHSSLQLSQRWGRGCCSPILRSPFECLACRRLCFAKISILISKTQVAKEKAQSTPFHNSCRAKSGSSDVSSRKRSMCQCEALLASSLLSHRLSFRRLRSLLLSYLKPEPAPRENRLAGVLSTRLRRWRLHLSSGTLSGEMPTRTTPIRKRPHMGRSPTSRSGGLQQSQTVDLPIVQFLRPLSDKRMSKPGRAPHFPGVVFESMGEHILQYC